MRRAPGGGTLTKTSASRNATLIVLFVALGPPAPVSAQALIPSRGVASVGLSYQYYYGGDHLFSTDRINGQSTRGYVAVGNHWYLGNDRANTISGSLDLGLTRRLAVSLAAAYVSSAYFGLKPIDPVVDDGQYHGALQDGLVRFRSPFKAGSFLVTPFLGAVFPLGNYPVTGHSAPGRRIVEVQTGVYTLHGLGPYASVGFVSADIGYGVSTDVPGFTLGRLLASVHVGYYQSRKLTISASTSFLDTFGGLEWVSSDPTAPSLHGGGGGETLGTQVAAARSVIVGLGLEWGVSDRIGLNANIGKTVWGENVEDALLIGAGIGWSFRMFGKSPAGEIPLANSN